MTDSIEKNFLGVLSSEIDPDETTLGSFERPLQKIEAPLPFLTAGFWTDIFTKTS